MSAQNIIDMLVSAGKASAAEFVGAVTVSPEKIVFRCSKRTIAVNVKK